MRDKEYCLGIAWEGGMGLLERERVGEWFTGE